MFAKASHTRNLVSLIFMLSLLVGASPGFSVESETYQMPPKSIADLAEAARTPSVSISPTNEWMLQLKYPPLVSIEEVSQPELRIGGLRINPRTNGPSRGYYFYELSFRKISDGSVLPVSGLPAGAKVTNSRWSPDGNKIAFVNGSAEGLELWIADVVTGQARRLPVAPLNAAYGSPIRWLSDNKTLIARTITPGRGSAPQEPLTPSGPIVQENLGRKAPARTYQDLLKNEFDAQLFEHYLSSQLVKVDLEGNQTQIGPSGIIKSFGPSPDGKLILVSTIHRPFSYTVPAYRFPVRTEVWDSDGNVVYQVADAPLADNIPMAFGSTRTGRREVVWRADADATLCWAEALDGGDAGAEADERDQVFMLAAPFDADPTSLITMPLRYDNVEWASDELALVSGWWWQTRNIKTWLVEPGDPSKKPRLLEDRSWEDRYNDPGSPMHRRTERGTSVLLTADKGRTLFLTSSGASPEGDRPFLDEWDLKTDEHKRLFRSEEPNYESPVRLIDVKKRQLLTRRESITEPPNYYLRNLKKGSLEPVTDFPHPTPQLVGVQKELIRYQREDGVNLTGTLYLPPDYKPEDGPLPMLMWAYPQEYKSADAAGQVTDSPYRFVRVGWYSPLMWLVHGYAVLDDPAMPIVGQGDEEPNDTFVEQLVSSAQAAVDEVVRRGVADPDRIAIGGHSYGAFMTANLLAHSDIYRAGIARSGAYNRTLTPFGFQAEERSLWESPEIYFAMSPFMHAEKVNEPILLIHGEADNNSGTYPLQSRRYYSALKGHGATARLVMLPHESHGYRGRESVMHMLWEMTDWMDTYVRDAEPRELLKTKQEAGSESQ
ncbi:MAG: prolyl oligopeptidase family serine peptidase [candidate division Zixibacteria bacterium]|nr:prolyl oligopeptidase family serine peptidase [candidate division Zixibacteria bacterium]MDH3937838.1 prolyl oligopeptidase family serine peptidase [candidate division Zixibacteria bacterium]MDH4034927.1 prolyl oligopeptidase family serine peptidase [candidate division Zixibacteria bacterium]